MEIHKPIGLNFKKANGKGGGLMVTVSSQTPLAVACLHALSVRALAAHAPGAESRT